MLADQTVLMHAILHFLDFMLSLSSICYEVLGHTF
jgi:hypothetical protein